MMGELNELPASFPTDHWSTVHLDIRRLLDRAVRWVLGQGSASPPIAEMVNEFKPLMDPLRAHLISEPLENIAHLHYTVFHRFHADSLLERIAKLPRRDRWQALGVCFN